jgi:serine/threonine protein phosphatase PrpC
MHLPAAATTTRGRRQNNEDALLVANDVGLFAVADGMGGYAGGEIASALALSELAAFVRALHEDRERTWPFAADPTRSPEENVLDQAIRLAHRSVIAAREPQHPRLGSTIVALYAAGDHVAIAHVGDSRIYRWRRGRLAALTTDHSVVAELRAAGVLGPEEAPPHLRNYVTRALGVEGWLRPTVALDTPEEGDRYLLCSDGISSFIPAPEIAEELGFPSRRGAVERLVHRALERGSTDNITAIVVGVGGRGDDALVGPRAAS